MPHLNNPNPKCMFCTKTLSRRRSAHDGFGYDGLGRFCSKNCGCEWANRHITEQEGSGTKFHRPKHKRRKKVKR